MNQLVDVAAIRIRDFNAEVTALDGRIDLKLSGNADTPAIEPLSELLAKLHDEAIRSRTTMIFVDFVNLEFMNSSCFKAFVEWIAAIQDAGEQYRVRFLSNPNQFWQSRSLHALTCFADDLITIDTIS